jgi:hypothetical protein
MSNAITKVEARQTNPVSLLEMAIQQGADLDKIEKFMDLETRWNAEQARKAYNQALNGFQSELGPIIKTRQAHNSKYADIDDIAQAIRPFLSKHGLSYTFNQDQEGSNLKVTCTIRHSDGHSESNTLSAIYDTSGGKNAIQAVASSLTYLRRYTLTGALGITTGNEDTDGGKPSFQVEDLIKYLDIVREEFPSIAALKAALAAGDYSTAKESLLEIETENRTILWRAPTKGSVFSTEERTQMKSNEWSKA